MNNNYSPSDPIPHAQPNFAPHALNRYTIGAAASSMMEQK